MFLISFIHITESERNITRKIGERCYKKYRVHPSSRKVGITTFTTVTFIPTVSDIFRLSKEFTN